MLIFLHGEDDFLLNRRRQKLQSAFVKKYPGAEVLVFDFEDQRSPEDAQYALSACESGLFAAEKMVVFLHPSELAEESRKKFLAFLKQEQEHAEDRVVLLFVQPGKIKKTDAFMSALIKTAAKEENFSKLSDKDVAAFIKKELAGIDKEMKISSDALQTLIAIVGHDTAKIVSELEKLAVYKSEGKKIEPQDVALLLEGAQESRIFEALDALGRGDRKKATLLFHKEVEQADGAYQLLSMCAWQARRLLMVREAYDQGMRRSADIATHTKLQPFAVQKTLATIENFPLARIKKGLAMLSDFDTQLKTGGMDPLVALDLFIWRF